MSAGGYHTDYTAKGWGPGLQEPSAPKRYLAGNVYNKKRDKKAEPSMSTYDSAANFEQFLGERKEGQPFCFWAGLFEPQRPWDKDKHTRLDMEFKDTSFPKFLYEFSGNTAGSALGCQGVGAPSPRVREARGEGAPPPCVPCATITKSHCRNRLTCYRGYLPWSSELPPRSASCRQLAGQALESSRRPRRAG